MSVDTLLVIIVALSVIAALVLLWDRHSIHSANAYVQRTSADAERYRAELSAEAEHKARIMQATRVIFVNEAAYIVKGVDDDNHVVLEPLNAANPQIKIDLDDERKRQLAGVLVDDSIRMNGAGATQLLTASQWEGMGHNRDQHGDALEFLDKYRLIKIKRGGREQGTYSLNSDLQGLLLAMAVNQINAPTPKQG